MMLTIQGQRLQQQLETLGDALRTLHTFFKGYAPGGIV